MTLPCQILLTTLREQALIAAGNSRAHEQVEHGAGPSTSAFKIQGLPAKVWAHQTLDDRAGPENSAPNLLPQAHPSEACPLILVLLARA